MLSGFACIQCYGGNKVKLFLTRHDQVDRLHILRQRGAILRSDTLHGQKYVDTCSSNISFQNHGH